MVRSNKQLYQDTAEGTEHKNGKVEWIVIGGGLEEGGQWLSLAAMLETMHMKLSSRHSLAAQSSDMTQRLMTCLKYRS